jgi:hypothetical protein
MESAFNSYENRQSYGINKPRLAHFEGHTHTHTHIYGAINLVGHVFYKFCRPIMTKIIPTISKSTIVTNTNTTLS